VKIEALVNSSKSQLITYNNWLFSSRAMVRVRFSVW